MFLRRLLPLLACVIAASACASDGRDLAAPRVWQTTTTRPPTPTSAPPTSLGFDGMVLTSPEFEPGDDAPLDATCNGRNVVPALDWSNVGEGAVELGLTLSDQTDPENPLLLWLMAGIDPSEQGIPQGTAPVGAFETLNDYGQPGWGNPCLEQFQTGRRDLQFRLYVMETPSGLVGGQAGNEAWDALASRAVDSATLLMRIDAVAS